MTAETVEIVATQMASGVGSVPLIGSLNPPSQLDAMVWTVAQVHTSAAVHGQPALVVIDGLRRALSARVYESENEVVIEDIDTGIFGTGDSFPEAVRDLHEALQEHWEVLSDEGALSPNLQQQLEVLRSYFR
jgi:hypothetical protein